MNEKKPDKAKTIHIDLRATPEEKARIAAAAAKSGRTMSEYVLACCLPGRDISKALPAEAVKEMIRLRGDIGKATGMLKLSLASGVPGKDDVETALRAYEKAEQQVRDLISEAARKLARC